MTDRDFNRSFFISFAFHLALVLMAYLGGEFIKHAFKSNDIEIIRSSVRVDVVGMPKFTVQELKAMQKELVETQPEQIQGTKEATKPKDESGDVIKKDDLVIKEESRKKTSFLNLISDYSSKKVGPKDNKKGGRVGSDKNLESLILEGNRLSKGSALVGDFSDQENSEFGSYVQTIPDQIRKFWRLPSYLRDQGLKCRVKIFLSPDGKLLKMELVESSGQAEFDARAQSAIRDASPFPRPSEKVAMRLASYGIILGFPL